MVIVELEVVAVAKAAVAVKAVVELVAEILVVAVAVQN